MRRHEPEQDAAAIDRSREKPSQRLASSAYPEISKWRTTVAARTWLRSGRATDTTCVIFIDIKNLPKPVLTTADVMYNAAKI